MKKNLIKLSIYFSILLLIYLFFYNLKRPFSWDELEHIHSAFLVSQGQIPYKDFFQHHHPLLWYMYAPFFLLFGASIKTLFVIKIFSYVVGVINVILIFFISKFFIKEILWRIFSCIIIASSVGFLLTGLEMRPDNLMITFILISFIFLLKYIDLQKNKFLILSGFALGISFLFLQKAIYFIFIFNCLLLFLSFTSLKFSPKKYLYTGFIFNLFLLVPVIIFLLIILKNNLLQKYYFLNWTLNFNFEEKFFFIKTLKELPIIYVVFFILFLLALLKFTVQIFPLSKARMFSDKNSSTEILLLINVCLVLFLITTRSPYMQYFLPVTFFGGLLIAHFLKQTKKNIQQICILICLLPLLYPPFPFSRKYSLSRQIEEIQRVLQLPENGRENLRVQHDKNLFATHTDYYWFSPEAVLTIKKLKYDGKVPTDVPEYSSNSNL